LTSYLFVQVIVKQEICRKLGYAVQSEEEMLKVQLEQLQMELNHPTQFKGRLNELMSQIRMQSQVGFGRDEPMYQMDANMQMEIKQVCRAAFVFLCEGAVLLCNTCWNNRRVLVCALGGGFKYLH
jgi:hypothetical protein